MAEIALRKIGTHLCPIRDQDIEWLQKQSNDDILIGSVKKVRNPKFFRKWWALVQFAYDHFEPEDKSSKYGVPEKNFDRFRKDLIVLSGYYDTTYKINGDVVLQAKSIAWHRMEEEEFSKLYSATFNAIAKHIFSTYSAEDLKQIEIDLEGFI